THVGMSPALLMACRKAGLQPGQELDLSRLKTVITPGPPRPPAGFQYVYEQLGPETLLINGSGGTDVCSAFVTGAPMRPVYEGELAGPGLAGGCKGFDEGGKGVGGGVG